MGDVPFFPGVAEIIDGSITAEKLSQSLQDKIFAIANSSEGAGGIRYYNNVWQYYDGTNWVDINLDGFDL